MKILRKAAAIAGFASLPFSLPANATGIPTVDVAVLSAVLQGIASDAANAAKEEILYRAQMELEQALSDQYNRLLQEVQSESTWRITDNAANIYNQEAIAASLPPPNACETYSSSRNAQSATVNATVAAKSAHERAVSKNFNFGPNATTEHEKREQEYGAILERFKAEAAEGDAPLLLRADNLMRRGEFQNRDITEEEEQARQDMLDLVMKVDIRQPIDFRKPVANLSEDDLDAMSQYMSSLGRVDIARSAAIEVYAMYTQGPSGSPSVEEVIADFNEDRFLDPVWLATVLNSELRQAPTGELTQAQREMLARFTQPEQVQREMLAISAFRAYVQEKQFKLDQWDTMMNSILLAQRAESR